MRNAHYMRSRARSPEGPDLRDALHIYEAMHLALSRWPDVARLANDTDSADSLREGWMQMLNIDAAQASAVRRHLHNQETHWPAARCTRRASPTAAEQPLAPQRGTSRPPGGWDVPRSHVRGGCCLD